MVKFITLAVTTVTTLAAAVGAVENCKEGVKYCGWKLEGLDFAKYNHSMYEEMEKNHLDEDDRFHSLFLCLDRGEAIRLDGFCGEGKCNDNNSDACGHGENDCCVA